MVFPDESILLSINFMSDLILKFSFFDSGFVQMDQQYVKLMDGKPTTCITIDSSGPELLSGHVWALWSTRMAVWNYDLEIPLVILNLTMGMRRSCEESEIVFSILTGGCNMMRKCDLLEESDASVGTQCSWQCTCETTPCLLELMVIYNCFPRLFHSVRQ